jgi:hypothetical protein
VQSELGEILALYVSAVEECSQGVENEDVAASQRAVALISAAYARFTALSPRIGRIALEQLAVSE